MNDTAIMELPAEAPPARTYAAPNARGQWPEDALDRKHAPGNLGALLLIEQADGWRAGWEAMLPEAAFVDPPTVHQEAQSREATTVMALERLISWCAEQKQRGKRKHKEAATQLQEWALELENRAKFAEQGAGDDSRAGARYGAPDEASGLLPGPPVLQTLASDAEIRMVPIGELHESPLNPRQIYPEERMRELVESMRTSGFRPWLPLVVRPRTMRADGVPAGEQYGYEIAAGHRRRRAAETAGIQVVPCIVRQMSDEEFLDVLNFDNSGREDVHPLHEASGWRVWMEKTGHGVKDIAARIGQSIGYVYQRLKYDSLIPEARQWFLDGENRSVHAVLIARLPAEAQKKALKFLNARADGRVPSVRELADWLHGEAYQDLRGCPFDRTDRSLLAGAGSCGECPKRAANIPGFEFNKEDPDADLCTDQKCYQQKLDNHLFRIRTDLLPEAGTMGLMVSENWTTKKKGAHAKGEWEEASKDDKKAQPAVVVEGPHIGQVIQVKLKPRQVTAQPAPPDPQEHAREEAKIEQEVAIRRAILEEVRPKIGGLLRGDIEAMLIKHFSGFDEDCIEVCDLHGIVIEGNDYLAPQALEAALPKLKENELFQLVIEAAVIDDLRGYRVNHEPRRLLALAKRYKVDAAKIRRDVEEAAKAAEGGTRREVEKAAVPVKPAKKAPAKKPVAKKAAKPKAKKLGLAAKVRARIAAGNGKK